MIKKKRYLPPVDLIIYHTVNSLLAGALVFVGAFADGSISQAGIAVAFAVALLVFLQKFSKFWDLQLPKSERIKKEKTYMSIL